MTQRQPIPASSQKVGLFLEAERFYDSTTHIHAEFRSSFNFIIREFYLAIAALLVVAVLFFYLIDPLLGTIPHELAIGALLIYGFAHVIAVWVLHERTRREIAQESIEYRSALIDEASRHRANIAQL